MQFEFFRYLEGKTTMKKGLGLQVATGLFECPTCYASSYEAKSDGIKVYWTCPNGHDNAEAIPS